MKKLTVVLLLMILAYTGFTQSNFRVQAGPVFNFLYGKGDAGDYDNMQVGYTIGAGYELRASKNFTVQPEFNYTHLKAKETVVNAELTFDYIQIPILLKAVTNSRNFGIYLGPQLGFITSAKVDAGSLGKADIKDQVTNTDFSAVLGLEYMIAKQVGLAARYTMGLSNVIKVEYNSDTETRHRYLSLLVSYRFGKN